MSNDGFDLSTVPSKEDLLQESQTPSERHVGSGYKSAKTDEASKPSDATDADSPIPSHEPAQDFIEGLLSLEGFETASKFITQVQRRVSLFRNQGRDLTAECDSMSLAITGRKGLDYTQAGQLYYEYLKAEGFFPGDEDKFVSFTAKSDYCSDCYSYSCSICMYKLCRGSIIRNGIWCITSQLRR